MGGHDLEARVVVMLKAVQVVGETLLRDRTLQEGQEDEGRGVIMQVLEELSAELNL